MEIPVGAKKMAQSILVFSPTAARFVVADPAAPGLRRMPNAQRFSGGCQETDEGTSGFALAGSARRDN
jgi:hypothetical protein